MNRFYCLFTLFAATALCGDELRENFDNPASFQPRQGARVAKVDGPAPGTGAIRISMPGSVQKKWTVSRTEAIRSADAKGIQFQVKGDGSANYGTLALWETPVLTYVCIFPLRETSWKTHTVAWEDFLVCGNPAAYDPRPLAEAGISPGALQGIELSSLHRFGKRNPAEYSIANLRFVNEAKVSARFSGTAKLSGVRRALNLKQAVRIICMGAFTQAFVQQLETDLRKRTGNDRIEIKRMEKELKTENDVCTLNQLSGTACDLFLYMPSGMEKLQFALPAEIFEQHLRIFAGRFANITEGKAALLILPPLPAGENREHFFDDYENAVRSAGKKEGFATLEFPDDFKKNRKSVLKYDSPYAPQLNAAGISRLSGYIINKLAKE